MNPVSTPPISDMNAHLRDAEAIRRAMKGDSEGFEYLYDTYKKRVYFGCLRMSGDRSTAEDLLQETFMSAFCHLASFRGDCKFSSWLFRIATNAALMKRRRAKTRILEVSLEAEESNRTEDGRRATNICVPSRDDGTLVRLQLERAIGRLPPGYKRMFILHDVEGYRHAEIARMVHCTVGNSKSQLFRARTRLRRDLASTRP